MPLCEPAKWYRHCVRAGKVVQTLSEALHHFDHENSIDPGSGAHTRKSEAEDLKKVIKEIRGKSEVLQTFQAESTDHFLQHVYKH